MSFYSTHMNTSAGAARIYSLSDTIKYLDGSSDGIHNSRTLTIQRSSEEEAFDLIVKLLCEHQLTKRELSILRTLVDTAQFALSEQVRKQVSAALHISRENLNNVLIRMQAKKFFDNQWHIPESLHILSYHKEISTVVVNV